jgi:hypothetical protein
MGKRSGGFEHRKDDDYPTPLKGVLPIVPLLRAEGVKTLAEPCGPSDSVFVRTLESFGFEFTYTGDFRDGHDAFLRKDFNGAQRISTNPPHSRPVLHPLIMHLCAIAPTWLLIDSDWKETRQAAPYMKYCSLVLPIGRLKWFEDSEYSGKNNFCWYRFDIHHTGPTVLLPYIKPQELPL